MTMLTLYKVNEGNVDKIGNILARRQFRRQEWYFTFTALPCDILLQVEGEAGRLSYCSFQAGGKSNVRGLVESCVKGWHVHKDDRDQ